MFQQTWWNDNIHSKINEFRQWVGDETAQSKQYIKAFLQGKGYYTFLDVGCGTATLNKCIKDELKMVYTGVDSCTYFIDLGSKDNINIINSDVRNMAVIPDSTYDFGFARHIFEHQESFNLALSELIRVSIYEACHIFFIKPGQTEEKNFDSAVKLYHNRYSISEINNYLKTNIKVASWEWVHINDKEVALHIKLIK
jgi:ubiquinone/menaquinone biosynthesis C-methylase UbiE